jgi:MFS family permease
MGGSPYTSGWGAVFFVSVATAAVLSYRSCTQPAGDSGIHGPDAEFRSFQRAYLAVYYLAMLADWLQGPYVYALYESYGFSSHDIAVLFVGGFGSSMLFGTFAGAAADRIGRKKCGLLYAVLYILSCMTKHFKDYSMLMVGRVLGGIATSLLFSTFESWLVCEHNARGYDSSWISRTFSLAYFGNSVAAILAGVMAEAAAEAKPLTPSADGSTVHFGGFTAPFDLSIAVLVVLTVALLALWNENYGSMPSSSKGAATDTLYKALRALSRDRAILLLGTCISFFEGSMYVFVFKWTPTLSGGDERPPYGLIFSTFMVLAMCGSSIFGIVASEYRAETILFVTFGVAAVALALPAVSSSVSLNFICFLVFEACVGMRHSSDPSHLGSVCSLRPRAAQHRCHLDALPGNGPSRGPRDRSIRPRAHAIALLPRAQDTSRMPKTPSHDRCGGPSPFLAHHRRPPSSPRARALAAPPRRMAGVYFPAMGMVKSQLVPEEVRATVYNIFRIPLNLIVLGVLLNSLSQFVAFTVCGSMLALAALCMHSLGRMHLHGYTVRSGECVLLNSADDKAETCQL